MPEMLKPIDVVVIGLGAGGGPPSGRSLTPG